MRNPLAALALAAGPSSLLDPLWALLASAWSTPSPDEGCIGDPNGRCTATPRSDAGCGADPSGRCNPAPRTDAGCGMDPSG